MGCIPCSASDSTNKYCFPGTVAGYIYYHSSYNSNGGFTCDTKPDPRVSPWCPCLTGAKPVQWIRGSKSTSCAATCQARSRSCNVAALKTATLESSCRTLMSLIPGKSCIPCSPSDSTNKYCFPGTVAGYIYYHSSYNSQRGFTCNTIPDQRVTPWCPCSG